MSPFEIHLRTGRIVPAAEAKFNPWHDVHDGRFTFRNSGRNWGPGNEGGGDGGGQRSSGNRRTSRPRQVGKAGAFDGGKFGGEGATGNGNGDGFGGYGGDGRGFGGGGAGGTWEATKPTPPRNPRQAWTAPRAASTALAVESSRTNTLPTHVRKNGYTFQIDTLRRPRDIGGDLQNGPAETRSRRAQLQAGGADRRPTDDGGHYIARRFNGPRDAFNHFAQDRNFNRGAYREMEREGAGNWRRATRFTCGLFLGIAAMPSAHSQSGLSGQSLERRSFEHFPASRAEVKMDDRLEKLSRLYSELGATLLDILGPGEHHATLYAEAGDMWTGVSVYRDEGHRIAFLDDVEDLDEIVADLWYAEPADKRWREMQFDLDGTKFHARNFYPEDLKKRESYSIRRERAVKERFGDKPIYYPPL